MRIADKLLIILLSFGLTIIALVAIPTWPSKSFIARQKANAVCEAHGYTTYKRPASGFIQEQPTQVKCIKITELESTWFYNL
jgi:hypothetical protein